MKWLVFFTENPLTLKYITIFETYVVKRLFICLLTECKHIIRKKNWTWQSFDPLI